MSQHYDILTVNAVLLLSSGYGYIVSGQQPTGLFLLFLSLFNVGSILLARVQDLERIRKEELMFDEEEDEDQEEEEEQQEDDTNANADDEAEEEEEEEQEQEQEQEDAQPTEQSDAHYCGSEACGEEITNLSGAGLCAGCGLVYYCDTVCQRADWRAGHKLICDKNVATESLPESVDEEVVEQVSAVEATPAVDTPALETVPEVAEVLPAAPVEPKLPPPPPLPPAPRKDMGFIV
jgi:chemotaxis protein histidine kinase CheA